MCSVAVRVAACAAGSGNRVYTGRDHVTVSYNHPRKRIETLRLEAAAWERSGSGKVLSPAQSQARTPRDLRDRLASLRDDFSASAPAICHFVCTQYSSSHSVCSCTNNCTCSVSLPSILPSVSVRFSPCFHPGISNPVLATLRQHSFLSQLYMINSPLPSSY